ncbi:alpha-pore-forming tripartite toxin MakABE regulator [Desulfobacter vibrioformis]|uniref:alpha-pore-forming tripartite toxin MakABE regulator n=1 Tax=Desulfobacter vibrioformis TaxID=34031 RepID=UPI0005569DD4|nr:hypothetical protein [Desulfobacter vibrioformis]
MATVNVLCAVDVEGALTSNNLGANVYMVDTNKYAGSGAEGTAELKTTLNIDDIIVWTVAPIDPGTNVEIQSFSGTAVSDGYINPVQDPLSPQSFESRFEAPGGTASGSSFQYTMSLSFEGKVMTFDPFLTVK